MKPEPPKNPPIEVYLASSQANAPGDASFDDEPEGAASSHKGTRGRQSEPTAPEDDGASAVQPYSPPDIPRYRYLGKIAEGEGGMGIVLLYQDEWRGEDQGNKVAIKFLKSGNASNEGKRRFKKEGEILSRLRHPHIIDCKSTDPEHDEIQEQPYLVLEYVDGPNLENAVGEKNPLKPLKLVAQVVLRLAETVRYLHRCGIWHRDLKPKNVLVAQRNGKREIDPDCLKIIDFGLAKVIGDSNERESDESWTQLGMGTVGYTAPELLRPQTDSGSLHDATVDVYSLGAILYRLLVGAKPERDPQAVLMDRRSNGAPALEHRLCQIAERCLQHAPKQRYQSMDELVLHLDLCCQGQAPLLDSPEAIPPVPAQEPPPDRYDVIPPMERQATWKTSVAMLGASAVIASWCWLGAKVWTLSDHNGRLNDRNAQLTDSNGQLTEQNTRLSDRNARLTDSFAAANEVLIAVTRSLLSARSQAPEARDQAIEAFLNQSLPAYYEQLERQLGSDTTALSLLAGVRLNMARTFTTLGQPAQAKEAVQRAVDACAELYQHAPSDLTFSKQYAEALHEHGSYLASINCLKDAKTKYEVAQQLWEAVLQKHSDDLDARHGLGLSLGHLGGLQAIMATTEQDLENARKTFEKCRQVRDTLQSDTGCLSHQLQLGRALNNLARVHWAKASRAPKEKRSVNLGIAKSRWTEATAYQQELVERLKQPSATTDNNKPPTISDARCDLVRSLVTFEGGYARVLADLGEYENARKKFDEGWHDCKELLQNEPTNVGLRTSLVESAAGVAHLCLQGKADAKQLADEKQLARTRLDEAIKFLQEGKAIEPTTAQTQQPQPSWKELQKALARCHFFRGQLATGPEQKKNEFSEAKRIVDSLLARNKDDTKANKEYTDRSLEDLLTQINQHLPQPTAPKSN